MMLFSNISLAFAENELNSSNVLENSNLFTENSISIKVGEQYPIKYNFDDAEKYNITLNSANEKIISVKDGKITGLSEGTTKLYLTVLESNNRYTDTCVVSVSKDSKVNKDADAVSLFSSSLSGQNLYNNYISIVADSSNFSLGTTGGNAYSTSDDNARLLYGWSGTGTSYATIVVDGNASEYQASPTYDTSNQTIWGTMQKNGVTITRKLSIIKSPSNGRDDIAEITYIATNNDTSSHQVGGRIGLDTMLGDNDHSPFQIQGIGAVTTQMQFVGEQIPQYWQSFDSLTSSSVSSFGTLYTNSMEKPDKVQFGNWVNLLSECIWEAEQNLDSPNGDSAVAITWYAKTLTPGQSRTFTTYYGLSAAETANQYTVNFDLNGGTGYCPSQIVLKNNFVISPQRPTRSGCIFTGWYANKSCTGDPYISSSGVAKRKITANVTLYAGWKSTDVIEWGKDTFKFGNINYFWGNKYTISDEYYNILTKDLGAYDKYCMGIQKNKDFGGSCYGMSVAMAMFEQGLMTPHFVWNGADNVHELPYPKNDIRVASLINYYQLSQSLPSISKKLNNQSKMGTKYLAKELVNALWNIKNTGIPVVIGYEYKDGWKWYKHAILAYKVEEDGLYYKVHIADPNNLAHSDPTASSFVVIEDTEPSYMYIDNDWSNISYMGAEGTHSFADNTFKLFCVLDDNSLYQSINIQEKLTNQCIGTSNYSLMLASLDETTAASHLSVNFDEFSIGTGSENTTISKGGISGDLEISDGTSNYGDNYVSYDLPYSEQYTVMPSVTSNSGYETTIVFENDYATFMSAKSEKIATFNFSNNGQLKIISDVQCNKTISYSAQNNEWLLGGIEVSANVNSLELEVLEDGRYHIKSSSSLKDAVVSIIDLDGNKTSVVVSDDVLEFIFTYSQSEQQYVISFEGTNNDEQITKSNTVVFYANGGSSIESISNIEYGGKITQPESPVYEGFIFDGWYIDETFTTEWNFETDIVTDNLILYAKWEEDPAYYHLVTFYDGEETSQIIVKDGDSLTTDDYPELVEKEGYYAEWQTINLTNITEDINIYSMSVPMEQVITATLNDCYYENGTLVGYLDYRSYINGIAQVVITDNNNETIEKTVDINISRGEGTQKIEIPIKQDDEYHNISISFYDNLEDKNVVGPIIKKSFYAINEPCYSNGFYYYITDDDKAEIIGYRYNDTGIFIPAILDGHEVTKIGDNAFSDNFMTYILIPDTITEIGENVFEGCPDLEQIWYIGSEDDWNSISIANHNSTLRRTEKVFNYSEDIVSGYLNDIDYTGTDITGIIEFDYCYKDCVALIAILDEYTGDVEKTYVISIERGTELKEISLPFVPDDKYHDICLTFVNNAVDKDPYCEPYYRWFYAEKPRYTDGDWVYTIVGENAEILGYNGDESTIFIPDEIGGYTVAGIGRGAFERRYIESVSFPDTLTYIGESAFAGASFDEITIPVTIINISDFAFDYCYNLSDIKVVESNPNYCSIDGSLYSKDKTELIRYALGKENTEFVIPDTVVKIHGGAISDAEYLEKVMIPDSVNEIGDYAFGWSALSEINIPASVEDIGNGVFAYCWDLEGIIVDDNNNQYTSINGVMFDKSQTILIQYPCGKKDVSYQIPSGVKTIATDALNGTQLQTIVIPKTIQIIEPMAMRECDNLQTIFFEGTEDEWQLIMEKTFNNRSLEYADIIFEYDKNMSVNGNIAGCYYDNNQVTANVKFSYIFEDCRVILGVYDKDDKLVTMTSTIATTNDCDVSLSCSTDESYKDYYVKVFFWSDFDNLKPLGNVAYGSIGDPILESNHPYGNNCDETKIYTYNGECESISLTFSNDTETESGYDYIYIYDANDNQIGRYTGTSLAGQTINVPGNTVKIRLTSDGIVTRYGYRTESIVVNR